MAILAAESEIQKLHAELVISSTMRVALVESTLCMTIVEIATISPKAVQFIAFANTV